MDRSLRSARGATLAALLAAGCGGTDADVADVAGPSVPPPIDVVFEHPMDAFVGDPLIGAPQIFDLILGDADLDGDLDCFVNRHHLQRTEVYENVGSHFEQINRRGSDSSGVFENRGIPDLYGETAAMEARVDASGVPGVYLWHDPDPLGPWRVRVLPAAGPDPFPGISLRANRPLSDAGGLASAERRRVSPLELEVRLDPFPIPRTFELANIGVSTQLVIDTLDGATSPIFIGSELSRFDAGPVSVSKRDPHGMALVDAVGSSHPDLFMTIGGLTGNLVPPLDPKEDALFEFIGGATRYREVPAGSVPPGYTRGRQVAWVDADADGVNELYVANTETPNLLFEVEPSGALRDVAADRGVDFFGGASFVWTDVNGDGALDLITATEGVLRVALREGAGFVDGPGEPLGLVLPAATQPGGLFAAVNLQVLDVDRDGDLDVVAVTARPASEMRVLLREGSGYVDATEALGLDGLSGVRRALPADLDNDGFMDLVVGTAAGGGAAPVDLSWWRNLAGRGFERFPFGSGLPRPLRGAFVLGDVDGDRWIDVVVVSPIQCELLRNASAGANRAVDVHVDLPLGTVVRGHYDDGTAQAQQWGAASVTQFSQSLQPLRFGQAPGVPLVELGVQLPGDVVERYRVEVPAGATRVDL